MITNVFRVAGFQLVSWFELRPDFDQTPGSSMNDTESLEQLAVHTLSAHARLQEEGHLSACVCSPSQRETTSQHLSYAGVAAEPVKLWLFFPGSLDTTSPSLKGATQGLRVVRAGQWSLPGEPDEVTSALTQALLNRLERSMRNLPYVRFGDVFVKCKEPNGSDPKLYSDGIITCEFVFAASEEAMFVHAMVRRKRVRGLDGDDLQYALEQHADGSLPHDSSLPVAVAPYGWSGRLTGCCPSDLVTRLKRSKLQAANDQAPSAIPFPNVSFPTTDGSTFYPGDGRAWVYAGYPEVCIGCSPESPSGLITMDSGVTSASNQILESDGGQAHAQDNSGGSVNLDSTPRLRGVYIFPAEAVLTPMSPKVHPHIYRKRTWLQNWAGTDWLEHSEVAGIMNLASLVYWNGGDYYKTQSCMRAYRMRRPSPPKSSSCSSSSEGGSSAESTSSSRGSSGSSGSEGYEEASTLFEGLNADADSPASTVDGTAGKRASRRTTSINEGSSQQPESSMLDGKGLQGLKRSRTRGLSETALKLARRGSMEDVSAVFEAASDNVLRTSADFHVSSSMGGGTPRPPVSQAGTPWDWADADGGIGMDMQNDADMLAEFGDFGDFFEDDGLGFGEPPGTAESQALFSFGDCGDGVNTPGTVCMDTSDPLLLPILDFPALEASNHHAFTKGLTGEIRASSDGLASAKSSAPGSLQGIMNNELEMVPRAEASVMFAPEFAAVEIPAVNKATVEVSLSKQSYLPVVVKEFLLSGKSDAYEYSALPPPSIFTMKGDSSGPESVNKMPLIWRRSCVRPSIASQDVACATKDDSSGPESGDKMPPMWWRSCGQPSIASVLPSENVSTSRLQASNSSKLVPSTMEAQRSTVAQLATDLNCALLQLQPHCALLLDPSGRTFNCQTEAHSGQLSWKSLAVKEEASEVTNLVDTPEKSFIRASLDRKKKERIPSRIAGDVEEVVHDGHRAAQVGVWRPVGTPKPQKGLNAGNLPNHGIGVAADRSSTGGEESFQGGLMRQNQLLEYADAVPLLAQQAAVAVDIVLDGECGDGPYQWLASREQSKRLGCCASGMVHKGCGGMFTLRHWLEISGLELIDPVGGEVTPAMASNVVRRDVRWAMAHSFGKANFDGPLTMAEWCSGRAQSSDYGELAGNITSDSKASAIHVSGEHLGQQQNTCGPPGSVKGNSSFSSHLRIDDGCHRRSGEDSSQQVLGSSRNFDPSVRAISLPGVVVGYQDDWLKTNFSMLRHWEKAPFEPFALPKPVLYHVVCLGLDSLLSAAGFFFSQLSSVYEICGLGSHLPAGGGSSPASMGKIPAGFRVVDLPGTAKGVQNPLSLPGDYVASMDKWWNKLEFRKAFRDACKSIPVAVNTSASQRDPETSPCTVVYVVCPTSEPVDVLQMIVDSCQVIGSSLRISEGGDKGTAGGGQGSAVPIEEAAASPIVACSISRFALQVVTADVLLKISGHVSCNPEILKDIAFEVYNKARRIPRRCAVTEPVHSAASRIRSGSSVVMQPGVSMPGMWKDCNTNRTSISRDLALENSLLRSWESPWQSSRGDSANETFLASVHMESSRYPRYLYEPVFVLADTASETSFDLQSNRLVVKDANEKSITAPSQLLAASMSEPGTNIPCEVSETDLLVAGPDLHCCYVWAEDWQWLVSVWTDARGELLDIHVWPLAGVGGTSLQVIFSEVLHQGLLLLQSAVDGGSKKCRNVVISRLGGFSEVENHDWQRVLVGVGLAGKNWGVQIRQSGPEDVNYSSDRVLGSVASPASPSISMLRKNSSNFGMSDLNARKLNLPPQFNFEAVRGALHCVQSISLVSVRLEHSLQVMCCSEFQPSAGPPPTTVGIQPVTSLAAHKAAMLFVPTHSIRFLSSTSLLPGVVGDVPPLGQLVVQNNRMAQPLASAFVVTPQPSTLGNGVWPSTLFVGLIASFSISSMGAMQQDLTARSGLMSEGTSGRRNNKACPTDGKDTLLEARKVLEVVAPQLQALSWLSASPMFLQRRSPLPFHCDIAQKLSRLLSFMAADAAPPPG